MKLVISTVRFQCVVRVLVPKHLSLSDERLLARKLAVARIQIADQSAAPNESAEYEELCSAKARKTSKEDWAAAKVEAITEAEAVAVLVMT